jgi:hypothetical protein
MISMSIIRARVVVRNFSSPSFGLQNALGTGMRKLKETACGGEPSYGLNQAWSVQR